MTWAEFLPAQEYKNLSKNFTCQLLALVAELQVQVAAFYLEICAKVQLVVVS